MLFCAALTNVRMSSRAEFIKERIKATLQMNAAVLDVIEAGC